MRGGYGHDAVARRGLACRHRVMWHFCNSCAQSLIKMNSNNDQFAEIQNKKAKYHSHVLCVDYQFVLTNKESSIEQQVGIPVKLSNDHYPNPPV